MQFLKDLIRNLGILLVIGLVVFFMYPDLMKQVGEVFGSLFGPLAILMVVVFAIPRRRRSK